MSERIASIESRREKCYRLLRVHDFELYRYTIHAIESVTLTHGVSNKIAAEYESAAVALVCQILKLK